MPIRRRDTPESGTLCHASYCKTRLSSKKEGEREKDKRQTTCSTLKRLLTGKTAGTTSANSACTSSLGSCPHVRQKKMGREKQLLCAGQVALSRSLTHSTLKNSIAPKQANAHQGRAGLPVRFQAHMSSIGDKKHLWDRHGT